MIRNLKALGLLVVAALATSAMLASAAQAQLGTLTTGETPNTHETSTIIGEQYPDPPVGNEAWNYFQREGSETKVRCDTAKLTATSATGVTTNVTVNPDYIHCYTEKGAEIHPATVTMEKCDYTLTQPSTIAPLNTGLYTGKADLTCKEKTKIIIHVYGLGNSTETSHFFNVCTIEVWPKGEEVGGHKTQELGGHVIYQNIDPTPAARDDDITAKVTLEGITSETNCPGEPKLDENGVYKQTVTVKAFEDEGLGKQLDAWISDI